MTSMMQSMFRKSLLDLVKGLRSNKADEVTYINQCLSEIKDEVKDKDHDIKATAIQKLSYLYMLGYDVGFAYFNIVEVMSQPAFGHKRAAYLCGSLAFVEDTEVLLLTPQLFKKAFSMQQHGDAKLMEGLPYEAGCALNCLANICTPYLAEMLLEDIYGMMNSSRPYQRKKAVLVLYAVFRKFPRALRLSFERLKLKLKDDDTGVQNAAVNVICELARKNPSNYLALLPLLFDLLNNSNNNWMLIKLVKLLGSLIPAEPRLARKLADPLIHIISNTPAKSLLYECINTATNCDSMSKAMVRLCLEKLRSFVEDPDQNLKYLGLLGLNKIMKHNAKAVAQHRELILQCLDDSDVTIRMRALDLITSMVTERNLEAIIQRLSEHLHDTDGSYRDHVLEQIIRVCQKDDYEYVRDFAWYIELLTNMTLLPSMSRRNAELIAQQLTDVTIRVPQVREFSVRQMEKLIVNNGLIGDSRDMSSNSICRVLRAAAFIVGEYSDSVSDHLTLVRAMLQLRIASLPHDIQCIFIHNALKVVGAGLNHYLSNEENQTCKDLINGSVQLLEPLAQSQFIEVQERATAYLYFMKWLSTQMEDTNADQEDIVTALAQVFCVEMNPVHKKHQAIVAKKIPSGLSLEDWLGDPWPDTSDKSGDEDDSDLSDKDMDEWFPSEKPKKLTESERRDLEEKRKARAAAKEHDPYYLAEGEALDDLGSGDEKSEWTASAKAKSKLTEEDISGIPVKVETERLGVKVFPKRNRRRPKRSQKYTVKKGPKMSKLETNSSDDDQITTKHHDPLAEDMDFSKPCHEEMPTTKPYKQENLNREVSKSNSRKKGKGRKKGKRRKKGDKKDDPTKDDKKKKGKKSKKDKKSSKETTDMDATEALPEKGKKSKKTKKSHKDKSSNKGGDDLLDLLDFGGGTESAPSATKPAAPNGVAPISEMKEEESEEKSQPQNGAPPLDAEFDPFAVFDISAAPTHKSEKKGESHKKRKEKKSKKSHKSKSSQHKSDKSMHDITLQSLISDDNLSITYNVRPSPKKSGTLIVNFRIDNCCNHTIKSVKAQISKNKTMKPVTKDSSAITLGRKIEANSQSTHKLAIKCKDYIANESLKCKLHYTIGGSDETVKHSKLSINISTHAYVTAATEKIQSESQLMDFLEESDACPESSTERIKLSKNRSMAEALDILVKLWRVDVVESSEKKASYYGQLLLDRHLAILVKISKSKHMLQVTARSPSKAFGDAFLHELKSVLVS